MVLELYRRGQRGKKWEKGWEGGWQGGEGRAKDRKKRYYKDGGKKITLLRITAVKEWRMEKPKDQVKDDEHGNKRFLQHNKKEK
jgi:hypothetical protein